ncbi:MAG: hypothetical protein WB523_11135 [Candidatus Sulfotelmatobacter sp.]
MNYDNPQFIARVKKILLSFQRKTDCIEPKDAPRQEGEKPPQDTPLVPETTPAPERQKKTCHCKPDQTPLWKKLLETAAVLVGIYVAYIYHGQLVVMQGQLGEIVKQYPELQKSANAAKSASETAASTLISSAKQFREEQRPYIWGVPIQTQDAGVRPPSGKSGPLRLYLGVVIQIKNSGQSPATEVVSTGTRFIIGPTEDVRKKIAAYIPKYETVAGHVLVPGETNKVHDADNREEPISISNAEATNIQKDVEEAYFIGAVRYRDIFDPAVPPM